MRIIVLGAGVIGTASAWYLAKAGHEVVVVERREGAGLETSFANGGQVSVGHAEPWANPAAPAKILKWLARDDAPLLFRLRMDPAQWAWGLRFLHECMAWRTRENVVRILGLALHGRTMLQRLREETGIAYEHATLGILHYFTDRADFAAARETAAFLSRQGLDHTVHTVEEALAIEPALRAFAPRIVGATYTRSDESGDAHLFTRNLAALCEARGVAFRYRSTILGLRAGDKGIAGVVVTNAAGEEETVTGDAYVVALGSYSPLLTRPLGIVLPIYPAKGYSATVAVADPDRAPRVCLTDEEAKLAISRLGERLRIAGTAELSGWSTDLNPVRCEALVRRAEAVFPEAADWERPAYWAGLRPATPSNVPLVGPTRIPNLWLNTGHGTLGWTMACGSGATLADLISRKNPK